MEAAPHPWPAIGVLLLRDGLVTKEHLEAVLAEQRDSHQHRISGWRLGEILVERGIVTQEQVARLVAEQYELPFIELEESAIDPAVSDRLPGHLAERFSALPIELLADGSLLLAVADPATVLFSDELRRAVGTPLRFVVVSPADLRAALVSLRSGAPPTTMDDPASTWRTGPAIEVAPTKDESHSHPGVSEDPAPAREPLPTTSACPPLGTLLVRDGLVSEEELETALAQQRLSSNKRLGEILVERGSVTRADVARIVAEQYELPYIDLVESELDPRIGALLPHDIARRYLALPLSFETDGSLLVAVADPTKVLDPEEILAALGARFSFAVADPDAIESAILRQRFQAHVAPEAGTTQSPSQPPKVEDPVAEPTPEPVDVSLTPPSDEVSLDAALREEIHAFAESGADELPDHETSTEVEQVGEVVVEVEEAVALVESPHQADVNWDTAVPEVTDPVDEVSALASDEPSVDTAPPDEPHAIAETDHVLPQEHETPSETEPAPEEVVEVEETVALAGGALVTDSPPDTEVPETTADSDISETMAPAPIEPQDALEPIADKDPDGVEVFEEFPAEPVKSSTKDRSLFAVMEVDDAADASDPSLALDEPASIEGDHGADEPEVRVPAEDPASAPTGDTRVRQTDTSALDVVVRMSVPERLPNESGVPEAADVALESEATVDRQAIVERAQALGASSLHFSAQEHGLVVRARVDGVMRELEVLSGEARVNTELVLGELARSPHRHDVEVTILPTQHGETVTVHVRPAAESLLSLTDLSVPSDDEETLRSALGQSSGLVLVTGSAGSGRTTTLYAALQELISPERALMTVEDPVLHAVRGVDQVAVDRRSGLSFARALRTILRADPDVILVGEIADAETAELAVYAASSRLVLSTVLAPTATSAISRLLGMGVSPDELASTLTALVTQRLARRICTDCRESYYPTAEELAELGRPQDEAHRRLLGRGGGCAACGGTGYRGRVGVISLLPLTDEIRALLAGDAPSAEIERAALAAGARTLRDETVRLCLDGVTTSDEVRRVAGWARSS